MEAGKVKLSTGTRSIDLIDAMVAAADSKVSDADVAVIERSACPTCGSCSGMFTANSMNCLTEALGLSLPGNGTVVATHADRRRLFVEAGHLVVDLARRWYEEGDEGALPRGIATFKAFENAMTLDIAMGGSTNTVLHLLAAAHEGEVDFTMADIDRLSRRVPVLVQGRAVRAGRACRGRPSRRRGDGHPGRARPRRPAQSRRPDGPCRVARTRAVAQRHHARKEQGDARILPRRSRRRADPGRVQPVGALSLARRGPREGRHPRRPSTPSPRTAASPCFTATSPSTARS